MYRISRFLVCAVAVAISSAVASATLVDGRLQSDGANDELVDAVAMPIFGTDTKVVLSSKKFDRAALAEDGVLNFLDLMDLRKDNSLVMVEFDLSPGEATAECIELRIRGQNELTCSDVTVSISAHDKLHIAGSVQLKRADLDLGVRFDVPIQSDLQPAVTGVPLPADAGAPGKALMNHLTVSASGNFEQVLALAHPRKRAAMQAMDAARQQKTLELMQKLTPTQVKVQGGTINGKLASVNFSGQLNGAPTTGTAEMEQVDEQWYVLKLKTRS